MPIDWPTKGNIEFQNVTLRYDTDLDPVIKNVTFGIRAGEKIGICGRSGCGKSSLMSALFRIIPTDHDGRILIDGVDISTVEIEKLRVRLSMVPQDVVLFSGTIRYD